MRVSLNLIQRWIWRDPLRRGLRLLRFAEVEADGGRDLARAAELTGDARLRRRYLRHALDERRHAEIFRSRGIALLRSSGGNEAGRQSDWLTPGERGLDDVEIERGRDAALLAFLHLSERSAARQFATYGRAVGSDAETRDVFSHIVKDEAFHMTYTRQELGRIAPRKQGWLLWRARLGRLWKGYLRIAAGIGNLMGSVILTLQYFILVPPFAWIAKRAARREPEGWSKCRPEEARDLGSQF
ncbi:ferritin-like domain-containing protein [Novosphingobium sp. G106]|uniref:ferritin-like domain-containing protein n=1 Tax=Novosphingobium sp. G106 TaxID=2849500 RepID=UPI001C2DEF5D|nr:ferritin-like domain-containing protein [Novosphingobium sp. G106]MBV1691334.1 ferritin-like domain-containing protein [Novosphingobium sp. G106]